jgi:hypothetical protein
MGGNIILLDKCFSHCDLWTGIYYQNFSLMDNKNMLLIKYSEYLKWIKVTYFYF